MSGAYEHGGVTIRPAVSVAWFEETQKAYTDSLSNTIPETTVSLGEVRFGPTFEFMHVLAGGGVLKPSVGISGVWNFAVDDNNASQGFALGEDDLRARIDAGASLISTGGLNLMFSGFFDGLGVDGYEAYGGTARLTVPLN